MANILSRKAKYGIRALLRLARTQGQDPVLISDLAARERIPPKFLELILLDLKHHGLLQSRRGRGGGYILSRSAADVTLGQVIRILDGPLAPVPCVSQMAYVRCDECLDEVTCGIRLVMKDVRDETARILDNTTLAEVLGRIEQAGGEGRPRTRPQRDEATA